LDPGRAGAFFADWVLLVEGPTEVALVNYLADQGKLELPSGTYVVDTVGKYNTHRFMNLFGQLGIRHGVLVEDDDNKNEHEELNQLIVDSANEWTTSVAFIPGTLEALLEAPDPGHSHRKPQHILHCLTTDQLSDAGLRELTKRVEEAISRE
jgi:predicted ATP-dependent endonuclease of OLD family